MTERNFKPYVECGSLLDGNLETVRPNDQPTGQRAEGVRLFDTNAEQCRSCDGELLQVNT